MATVIMFTDFIGSSYMGDSFAKYYPYRAVYGYVMSVVCVLWFRVYSRSKLTLQRRSMAPALSIS